MSGESGQLWPSHHQLPLSLCIWKGRFEKLALARRKAQGCVFVKASVKSCLRFKMGDASIISHRHIVWANWSLCLNNINLGSIFCPPLHTHAHVFNIAFLLSSHTTSAALSSAVPEKKNMVASTSDDTEQRSHQLPFMLPAVTLPQTSTRFRSAPS